MTTTNTGPLTAEEMQLLDEARCCFRDDADDAVTEQYRAACNTLADVIDRALARLEVLQHLVLCEACEGSGHLPYGHFCGACNGLGVVRAK